MVRLLAAERIGPNNNDHFQIIWQQIIKRFLFNNYKKIYIIFNLTTEIWGFQLLVFLIYMSKTLKTQTFEPLTENEVQEREN
jgi:hypothetical protein